VNVNAQESRLRCKAQPCYTNLDGLGLVTIG
jgi:hypothetical protein